MKSSNAKSPVIRAAAAAMLLVTSAAFAADRAPGVQKRSSNDAMFERLDTDGDGFVSLAEAKSAPLFAKGFDDADENRDQRLSPDEFVKARAIHDRARIAAFGRDALITAKVKALLIKDRVVNGLDLGVETSDGVVVLSGEVASPAQAARAKTIAAGVDGVRDVVDRIALRQG